MIMMTMNHRHHYHRQLFVHQWRNKRTDRTIEMSRTARSVARHWQAAIKLGKTQKHSIKNMWECGYSEKHKTRSMYKSWASVSKTCLWFSTIAWTRIVNYNSFRYIYYIDGFTFPRQLLLQRNRASLFIVLELFYS